LIPYLLKRSSRHFQGIYKFWKKDENVEVDDMKDDNEDETTPDLSVSYDNLGVNDMGMHDDSQLSPSPNWNSITPSPY